MPDVLFNSAGKRLYLTHEERLEFLAAADALPRAYRSFCYVLCHTGCRISEALALPSDRIDFKAKVIVFESLKKRKAGVYRAVPVPPALLDMLELVHDLKRSRPRPPAPLWAIVRIPLKVTDDSG